jgi:hypothetical protein
MYHDFYHGKGVILSVRFSPTQFAELITTLNCGQGVPCTLEYVNGERMPEAPSRNRRAEVQSEFSERMDTLTKRCEQLALKILELESSPRVNKGDLKELRKMVDAAVCELRANVPFAHECFNEACDKTVAEAKGEVDAALTGMINRLGGEKLAEMLGTREIELTSIESTKLLTDQSE